MSQDIVIELVAAPEEHDPAEVDRLTRSLCEEILQVDEVDSVDRTTSPAPEGTKAVDVAAIGALVVAAAPGVVALTRVIDTVRGWFSRQPATSAPPPVLKMTIGENSIEIPADEEQREALFAEFIAAVRKTGQPATPPPAPTS
jgi:hypothetical protein